jgi:hypothetical protein
MVFKSRIFWGYLIGCISILLLGWYLIAVAQNITQQFIDVDDRLSASIDLSIKNLLQTNINQSGPKRFATLNKSFPVVDQIKIRRINLAKIYVQILAPDLIYRLGSSLVLTSTGEVFLASSFSHRALQDLPIIFLHTNADSAADVDSQLIDFLRTLPDFVYADYEVHWYGANQIKLIARNNKNHHLITRHDLVLTLDLFEACHKLINSYQIHAKRKCAGIIGIDLRFEQQIIVAC